MIASAVSVIDASACAFGAFSHAVRSMDPLGRLFDIARRAAAKSFCRKATMRALWRPRAASKTSSWRSLSCSARPTIAPAGRRLEDRGDPRGDARLASYAEACAKARPSMTPAMAARLVSKPLYFGGMMVRQGDADAMVAGCANPTRRVIEAGLMTVGLAHGIALPSSCFLMVVPDVLGSGPARLRVRRLRGQCRSDGRGIGRHRHCLGTQRGKLAGRDAARRAAVVLDQRQRAARARRQGTRGARAGAQARAAARGRW